MPFLIDLEALSAECCNEHTESMSKALREEPAGDGEPLWAPHENIYIRQLLADVTARFQRILEALQDAIARLMTGEPIGELRKALEPWMRWDQDGFELARKRLNSKPPSQYSLDDWMLAVDYLIQRYLPDGVIASEAQYLSVRAILLGKVQANMAGRSDLTEAELEHLGRALPTEVRGATEYLNKVERGTLEIAAARSAINIKGLSERVRTSMKTMIVAGVESLVLGKRDADPKLLRQRLFDAFGQHNRDFRRIAVTETGEACNQGFVAATPPGGRVKRLEAYRGACAFCQSINGKVFTVVDPGKAVKDGATEVWVGKTNVGRSASATKRVPGGTLERTDEELWWPAAGVQHPNCRGRWLPVADVPPGIDPAFAAKLEAILAKGRVQPPAPK